MARPGVVSLRPVRPVLQQMVAGFEQDASRYIADKVLPAINTDERTGQLFEVGLDAFFGDIDVDTRREPGADYEEAKGFDLSMVNFDCQEYGLKSPLIDDETLARSQFEKVSSMAQAYLRQLYHIHLIKREERVANLLFNTTTFTNGAILAAGSRLDEAGGDPMGVIQDGVETIKDVGRDPNIIICGRSPYANGISQSAQILSYLPDNTDRNLLARGRFASLMQDHFGIGNTFVGEARRNTVSVGQSAALGDIWGNFIAIGYIEGLSGAANAMSRPGGGLNLAPTAAARLVAEDFQVDVLDNREKRGEQVRLRHNEDEIAVSEELWYIIQTPVTP